MDRMIYLSMSGAKAALQRQDSLANNLANVTTNGFRARHRQVDHAVHARSCLAVSEG
jgi:flagellar basal body rod protein FlgF